MGKKKTDLGASDIEDFIDVAARAAADKAVAKITNPDVIRVDEVEIENYIESHSFDVKRLPPENSGILYYNGLPIGGRQNIVTITGLAKSRKTVVASAIATSCFLQPGSNFLGFTAELGPGEKIAHIDTEQGYAHYYESVLRIFRDAGIDVPDNFKSVHTRDAEDPEFVVQLIEYILEKLRPSILIIDGVTDMVNDINDQKEANKLTRKILKWTTVYDMLCICVIHTTKKTGFMTGAIGTYLEKRAQTAIKVTKDEKEQSISHVECQYSRDESFKSFSIEYDKDTGSYKKLAESAVNSKGKGGSTDAADYNDDIHLQVLTRCFNYREALKEYELIGSIQKGVKIITADNIPSKKIRAWIKYYQTKAWIFCSPENLYLRIGNQVPNNTPALFPMQINRDDDPPLQEENPADNLPDNNGDELPF